MKAQVTSFNKVLNGKVIVTSAGTKVQLGSANCGSVTITALTTNVGIIYIGDSAMTSANGYQLAAGNSVSGDYGSLGLIWVDAATSNDGVTYLGGL